MINIKVLISKIENFFICKFIIFESQKCFNIPFIQNSNKHQIVNYLFSVWKFTIQFLENQHAIDVMPFDCQKRSDIKKDFIIKFAVKIYQIYAETNFEIVNWVICQRFLEIHFTLVFLREIKH